MSRARFPGARAVVLLAFVTAATFAADAVRLRPLVSIYTDAAGAALHEPQGVGCGAGSLLVADTGNGRVLLYAVEGDVVRATGEITLPELPVPLRVARRPDGELLALDGRSRRLVRFTEGGESRGYLEPDLPGERVAPRSFRVTADGRVLVLDVAAPRVLVLGPSGKLERSIGAPPEVGFPSDLAVDARGDVYVVDSVGRRVWVARGAATRLEPLTGSLSEDLDFPTSIVADPEGRLLVLDQNGGGIVVLGRDGSFAGRQLAAGWREGFVRYPTDACIDPAGRLALAERGNDRIQLFAIR